MNPRFPGLAFAFALAVALASEVVVPQLLAHSGGEERSMNGPITVWSIEEQKLISTDRVSKSDPEWRTTLTEQQFKIARKHGTEPAFSGALWDSHEPGYYECAACGNDLFTADAKFDAEVVDGVPSPLPSYLDAMERDAIRRALERTRYNRTAAAQLLGITFRQLRYRMQRLSIK